jgi:hypothetical protein
MADRAHHVKRLADAGFPEAKVVRLVRGNLNTRRMAPPHEAFPAEEVGRLADKLEIRRAPRHGPRLSMAEIELQRSSRGLPARAPTMERMGRETEARAKTRNGTAKTINRRFTPADARVKLTPLYPQSTA